MMHLTLTLLHHFGLASARHTSVPTAAGVFAGLASVLFRGLRPWGRDSQSLMAFSCLGALRCICGSEHSEVSFQERRQVCRGCGGELVEADTTLFDKQLSKAEIRMITQSLQRATVLGSHLDLPSTITSVDELHRYLDGPEPKLVRTAKIEDAPVEHPQVY